MDFSARVTLAPYETKVTAWMSWPSREPAVLTVSVLVSAAYGEFDCAIEEREGETAYTRYSGRHSTVPASSWALVEVPQGRQMRMRCTSHAYECIQFDVGLRDKTMP